MRPSLSGRSLSLYSAAAALYRSATALYRSATAICRYAGSTTGFVHILGLHLSAVVGALLSLHYSSIAALLRRRPRVQIRPFCPRRRPNRSSRVQIMSFCPPPSSSIGVVPNCGKSPLISIPLTLCFHWDSVPNSDTPCGLCVLHVFAVANTRTRPVV